MHENRETSETPAAQSSRPAGEGSGRTTRMHVPEESDRGIVPMNHSNKIEQSMTESEEGRPLIEENTHQASTRPTQSGHACHRDWRVCGKRVLDRFAANHPR
jgi:hypothetical protein